MIPNIPKTIFSKINHHRIYIQILPELFREEMLKNIADIISERGETRTYDPTPHKEILNNLYWYLVGDKTCQWELNKGLYLFGNVGFGKTILIEAFIRVVEKYSPKRVVRVTGRGLSDLLNEKRIYWFTKRPLFVDDIVKECFENDWNKNAFIKVIEVQYNYGTWLFLTSNYTRETLLKYYGKMTEDRLVSRVNFIECKGVSQRK